MRKQPKNKLRRFRKEKSTRITSVQRAAPRTWSIENVWIHPSGGAQLDVLDGHAEDEEDGVAAVQPAADPAPAGLGVRLCLGRVAVPVKRHGFKLSFYSFKTYNCITF